MSHEGRAGHCARVHPLHVRRIQIRIRLRLVLFLLLLLELDVSFFFSFFCFVPFTVSFPVNPFVVATARGLVDVASVPATSPRALRPTAGALGCETRARRWQHAGPTRGDALLHPLLHVLEHTPRRRERLGRLRVRVRARGVECGTQNRAFSHQVVIPTQPGCQVHRPPNGTHGREVEATDATIGRGRMGRVEPPCRRLECERAPQRTLDPPVEHRRSRRGRSRR